MSELTKKMALASLAVVVGLGLIVFSGFTGLPRPVWHAGGMFFVFVGLSAGVLTFAPLAPEPLGTFLRRPMVSLLLLLIVAGTLCYTLSVGALVMLR